MSTGLLVNKKQSFLLLLIVALIFALFYNSCNAYKKTAFAPDDIKKSFEKKEKLALSVLKELSENPEQIFENESYFSRLSEEDGIEFFVFKNDSAFIWTGTLVHPDIVQDAIIKKEVFIETPSVKAVLMISPFDNNNIALIKLSETYSIQNKYIQNKNYISPILGNAIIFYAYTNSHQGVYFASKEPAFSFEQHSLSEPSKSNQQIAVFLFFALLISCLYFIKELQKKYLKKPLIYWIFSFLISIISWSVFLYLRTNILFQSEIFSPSSFAVFNWLSSLGEFIVIGIILSFYAIIFPFQMFHKSRIYQFVANAYLIILFSFTVLSIKWLIENSSLKFNFNDISNIDLLSILAILMLCVLFFSTWQFFEKLINTASQKAYAVGSLTIFSAIIFLLNEMPLLLVCLFSFLFPVIIAWLSLKARNTSLKILSIFIIALSILTSISYFTQKKEISAKYFLAQKIALDNDPLAELLFKEIKQEIIKDKEIDKFINDENGFNKSLLQVYLKDKYFSGYWDKYIFQVTPCFINDSIIVQPGNRKFSCSDFFMEKAALYGRSVNLEENLYILDYETGIGNYLAIIDKQHKDQLQQQHTYRLYIELNAKIIPEGSGYPELLLDNRYSKVLNNNNQYSYAKYKNGNLVLSSGNMKFPLQIPKWALTINQREKDVSTAQNNFVFKPNDELCIIVSSVDYGLIGKLTGLSYLVGILSLIYFLFNIYQTGVKQTLKNWKNFRTRIQILVAGTIALATIIFGIATIYYQLRQYDQQNDKIIREKLRSILTEVEQKIGDKNVLTSADEDLLSFYLIKLSNVFFTDLNLFNIDGELLASSRKNIFEMGLSSTKLNSFAFNQLNRLQNPQFIHREKIGTLSFFSAYTIVKNDDGKTLGYLNIPYFARQDEMEKEISFFVGALINVYVVLFLLSVFVAIIISRLIAEPLQLIRSRLGDIALGKPNTPIEWKSNDEIGLLINEYNRMILQLEESAELLARSERESAWREMARQVAHEIKNPLTPMKLSVQHLQRTWKENPEEFDQRLKKFTQNLIEQIDTLSNIANEFSDFAKMPRPKTQELDILQIALQSIEFFKPTTQSHFILQKKTENTRVLADKDQMIRVFNNLLKNAIQAIEVEEDGLIEVSISKENEMILISVRDNGNGIDDELKDKIFRPNFTTKTSGMGLGLAMVKNIISSHGGNIWFESEPQKGTTFFFTLPLVENPSN